MGAAEASPSPAPDHGLGGRFARLSALNILANITVPLTGLVDTAMLGHLDDIRFLAGVALGSLVFDYVFWTFGFLRMATTGLVAQAVGRRDAREIEAILRRSLVLAAAAGAAILLLRGPLGAAAFALLSGDAGAEAAGLDYYGARVWGAPAALANFVFLGWFLGREESRVALVMTLVANVANVALDYLFIIHLDQAAAGAGYATMLSQYLMLTVAVVFYWRRRRPADNRRLFTDLVPWKSMFGLQRDIMVRTLFLVSTFAVFTDFSARLGTDTLAANALLLRWVTLAAFFIDGTAFAVESLAGVLHGAGARRAFGRLLTMAFQSAAAFGAAFAFAAILFPAPLLGTLTSHAEVISLGSSLRWWLLPVLLFGSAAYVLDGLFLGLTEGRSLRNAMASSAILGFGPMAWLALHRQDTHLLWAALASFMCARVLTLGLAWRRL
ncbi:MAG: MATE family efflux transporter [Acidobacteriota bacterium]